MRRAASGLLAIVAVAAAAAAWPQDDRSALEGVWSATVQRHTVPAEDGRTAAVIQMSGALLLTSGEGLSGGFRAEAIGFDDGRDVRVGRMVWTDERGDRIFSELTGETLETGRRIVGRITGGTGRYEGLTGDYAFTWQYVVWAEDGAIQGRTTDLKGRFRLRPRPQ